MNVGSAKAVAVKENDIGMANPGLHCGARAIIGSSLYRGGSSNTGPTVEQLPWPWSPRPGLLSWERTCNRPSGRGGQE